MADLVLALAVAAVPVAGVVLFGAVELEHLLPLETAALGLGGVAVLLRGRRGVSALPIPGVTLPVLLLAAVPALQLLPVSPALIGGLSGEAARLGARSLSVVPFATRFGLLGWLAYAAFLIAAIEVARRPRGVHRLLDVVAGLGIVEALYGIGNLISGNETLLWVTRETAFAHATGTLVNQNHYAAVLEVCLPAILARRWLAGPARRAAEDKAITAIVLVAGTVIGLALILSHSRAGVLVLVVGLGLLALLAPSDREGRGGRVAVATLAVLIVLYGGLAGGGEVSARFEGTLEDVSGVRPALWTDAASLLADFPIFGSGVGTFEYVFPAYRRQARDQLGYAHAHQDYFEVATDGGLVAVALVFLALLAFARAMRAGLDRVEGRPRLALAAAIVGVVSPLLHAGVDFPLHIPGISFLVLTMGAVALVLAERGARIAAPLR